MTEETTASTDTADTAPPAKTTLKARIEKDWAKLEGFVKTMELKFFGGKLHQKASHPLTNEAAWVPIESDEGAKDVPSIPAGTTQVDSSAHLATGTSEAPPPGGLLPAGAKHAHYPGSVSGSPAVASGGLVAPGAEQGSPTGTPLPPSVVVAESPAPGAPEAVLGTATST